MDHELALAYQTMQDETCPQCGHPVWVCRSRSNQIDLKVEWDTCQIMARIERDKHKKKPGEFAYVRPRMLFGKPMVSREDYFDALAEERAIHEKGKRTR